ncbi:MAG: AbrB/MazE/SpoVT family DNA-binding domain-containing protein [Chloroflexi bacterium]|nr:AbrB/MazE/SpoVT family DNA-binding domain-containing protein [Chloroflexota bacterium]
MKPKAVYVRVGKRAQVVIPAQLRREMGIDEGDTLLASVDDCGQLVLKPVPSDPVERFRAAWKGVFEGVDADAYIRELRDEWER